MKLPSTNPRSGQYLTMVCCSNESLLLFLFFQEMALKAIMSDVFLNSVPPPCGERLPCEILGDVSNLK